MSEMSYERSHLIAEMALEYGTTCESVETALRGTPDLDAK